jgi:hypothetical protein
MRAIRSKRRGVLRIGNLATAMLWGPFHEAVFLWYKQSWKKDKEFDTLYRHVFPNFITSVAKDPTRIAQDAKPALLSKDLNEISEHQTTLGAVVMFR